MSSQLSYGRHRGPVPHDARQAAVAVMMLCGADSLWVPLTMRPRALRHHGGQVCFPGGRVEAGETPTEAALREFHEELGPENRLDYHLLGLLSPVYVYASHNWVVPVVMSAGEPSGFEVDPLEVESIVRLPLLDWLRESEPSNRNMERPLQKTGSSDDDANPLAVLRWNAPYWHVGEHEVWGATAMILAELKVLLQEIQTS